MKNQGIVPNTVRAPALAALFLMAALVGPQTSAVAAEAMGLKDAGAVFNQWIAAYQARDAEKIMAVFDKTLVYSSQGDADLTYAELKKDYQEFFATKSPPTRWKAIPKEIHTQAGLAVVVSIWEQRQKDSSGHDELVARLRSIDIFRPTKAGWKIVRTINYSEPN
jgi:ketosteroid isomerase-like protein